MEAREAVLKNKGVKLEKFSYVVLRRGGPREESGTWPRLVQPALRRTRHVHAHLCCADGNPVPHCHHPSQEWQGSLPMGPELLLGRPTACGLPPTRLPCDGETDRECRRIAQSGREIRGLGVVGAGGRGVEGGGGSCRVGVTKSHRSPLHEWDGLGETRTERRGSDALPAPSIANVTRPCAYSQELGSRIREAVGVEWWAE
ncbi:uncharacterized protein LOC132208220 [Stegostoma tigrinum]|uniref:uncharacterized protein LOC132208220 n=1 Tax=Stegostoma tigrinum TaxID=3053191 RepID=UPI0028700B6A|nr:uncharacterized protein LOC132208220 [Stegostoma tigrinum]